MNTSPRHRRRLTLLSVVEFGGYPNLESLYRKLGYEVSIANSVRKAMGLVKKSPPDVIVAEFNYQPAFRDRTSNLESLLATVQHYPGTRVIAFFDPASAPALERLRDRFEIDAVVPYPVEAGAVEKYLRRFSDPAR